MIINWYIGFSVGEYDGERGKQRKVPSILQ
jgi:hypothetical protein